MDMKEFTEYLETEEGQEVINTLKQPLIDKNAELLGKIGTFKTDIEALKLKETERETAVATAQQKAEKDKLDSDNDVEAYRTFHESEMVKKDEAINALKSNFAKAELSRVVSVAAAQHSATPKPLELLLRNRVKSEYDTNGELQITVLDEAGGTLMHNGVKANLGDLVESLRASEENAPFFSGTGSSGAGTNTTDTSATVGKPQMGDKDFNLTEAMGTFVS